MRCCSSRSTCEFSTFHDTKILIKQNVAAAYEISFWNTEAAETDAKTNTRTSNLTLSANVVKIYNIEVAITWRSVKKYGYLKHGNKLPNEAHTNEIRLRVQLQHKLYLNSIYTKTKLDYGFNYNTSFTIDLTRL